MKKLQEEYLKMLETYRSRVEKAYGEDRGFAYDGPVDFEKWASDISGRKILFLLKEAYGHDEDDIYEIMNNSKRFNDSRTNLAISRLAYIVGRASESITGNNDYISDDQLFKLIDKLHDELNFVKPEDLKHSFSKIAVIEIKKISGKSRSSDTDIRKHSIENAGFLSDQIRFLKPNIIVCGGQVAWESLTQDMNVFDKSAFPSNEKGLYKSKGVIVYNSFHPSYFGFNKYDVAFDISKSFFRNSR